MVDIANFGFWTRQRMTGQLGAVQILRSIQISSDLPTVPPVVHRSIFSSFARPTLLFWKIFFYFKKSHKYQREIAEATRLELELHNGEQLSNIDVILDHQPSSKEYFCKFTSGETNWITIVNDTNPHVVRFFNLRSENIAEWMRPGVWLYGLYLFYFLKHNKKNIF